MVFEIPKTTLAERLAAVIPESALSRLGHIIGLTEEVVYKFRENFDIQYIIVPTINFTGEVEVPAAPVKKRGKRKKEFHTIATIEKILSKI